MGKILQKVLVSLILAGFLFVNIAQLAIAIDVNGELKKALLEKLSADPSTTTSGRVYYHTTDNVARIHNGTSWRDLVDAGTAQSIAGAKTFSDTVIATGGIRYPVSTLTVSSNTITKTGSFHNVSTGGGAVTLKTISGGTAGDILTLKTSSSSNSCTVDETGNISLNTTTFVMDSAGDTLTLIFSGSSWLEVARSNNS